MSVFYVHIDFHFFKHNLIGLLNNKNLSFYFYFREDMLKKTFNQEYN